MNLKHFRKLKRDQVNGKMAADTYRTAEIERRRQSMGWSNATGEGKTAVALSNLTGGDIWCETRETCMEAAKAVEGVWEYNPRQGADSSDCSREDQDQRGCW